MYFKLLNMHYFETFTFTKYISIYLLQAGQSFLSCLAMSKPVRLFYPTEKA